LFKFGNGFADGGFFDELAAILGSDEQSGGAQAVGRAGYAFGIFVDASQGAIADEQAAFVVGELDVAANVGNGLFEVERGQVIAGGDALEESFVRGQAKRLVRPREW
jgi:hypothetical protein